MSVSPTILITGASTGIGAVYADRFARRGQDLVLVARDRARLNASAARLRAETGAVVDLLAPDLTMPADIAGVEARLRDDARIGILVNNASAIPKGRFLDQSADVFADIISLNLTASTRLAGAIAPHLAKAGDGAIINLGSIVGLAPEFGMSLYATTKAVVLLLTQGLQVELGPNGVYVQAVLPAATRTEFRERSGRDVNAFPTAMATEELVDSALVSFDQRETVTIPSLPDAGQWAAFEAARHTMLPNLMQNHAAQRYRAAA